MIARSVISLLSSVWLLAFAAHGLALGQAPEATAATSAAEKLDAVPAATGEAPIPLAEVDGPVAHDDHADHDHDDHAHEHIGRKGMTKIDIAKPREDLAIFTFIAFALTLLILWKFAWGPINQALEQREHKIAEHVKKAEELEVEAQQKLAAYERKLFTAQDEVRAIVEEARRDGEAVKADLQSKAEAEILSLRERFNHEMETARAQALKELAEKSADLAIDLAGRMVGAQLNRQDHERLISEALAKVESRPSNN